MRTTALRPSLGKKLLAILALSIVIAAKAFAQLYAAFSPPPNSNLAGIQDVRVDYYVTFQGDPSTTAVYWVHPFVHQGWTGDNVPLRDIEVYVDHGVVVNPMPLFQTSVAETGDLRAAGMRATYFAEGPGPSPERPWPGTVTVIRDSDVFVTTWPQPPPIVVRCNVIIGDFGPNPPPDDDLHMCPNKTAGGNDCATCGGTPPSVGMAGYTADLLTVSLRITDTPLRYAPPIGPAVEFTARYNQRDADQFLTQPYSNLGPNWTYSWLSYVQDDPNNLEAGATVYVPGGGTEKYPRINPETSTYAVDPQTDAQLVQTDPVCNASSTNCYEKRFKNGSKQIFGHSNQGYPRLIFMTQIVDRAGKTLTIHYDSSHRITSVVDALGLETTLEYEPVPADPLKIRRVTDHFGRSAILSYYPDGKLQSIEDPVGIVSSFHYRTSDNLIDSLTTPYGTSHFDAGGSGTNRWLNMTDPRGAMERIEYLDYAPYISATDPSGTVPALSDFVNRDLDVRNTFYWDKKTLTEYPLNQGINYTKAKITHWLRTQDGTKTSGIVSSEKRPLENRVWYAYPNQLDPDFAGTIAGPKTIARMLDSSTLQVQRYTYNLLGNVAKALTPSSQFGSNAPQRVTSYVYDTNGIDVLSIYQRTPAGASIEPDNPSNPAADKIATYPSYNALHEPLSFIDAAGQTTSYAYNSNGQILSIENARQETTSYGYGDGTPGKPVGYLTSITSPAFGPPNDHAVANITYDDKNRVWKVKDTDDYETVTLYDNLDRKTKITYPDTSYEEFRYTDNVTTAVTLDLTASRDRNGKWTYRHYNGNRQMDSMTDPDNRTTTYDWCLCGSLETIMDPGGHQTHFLRDLQSRIYQKVFDDQSAITYLYEGQNGPDQPGTTSRLKSMTDAKGQTTNYSYYPDDNVYQVTYSNVQSYTPAITYTYDPNYNRIGSITTAGLGTTQYAYYSVAATPTINDNKLETVSGPFSIDTIAYTYDELGRVHTQSVDGSMETMDYDSLGRLTTIDNALSPSFVKFTRVYQGVTPRLHTFTYPNGQTATYDYFGNNFDRRLQTLQNQSATTNLSQHHYTYDSMGQIQSWTKTLGQDENALAFDYDDAEQLVIAYQGSQQTDYAYDDAGNKLQDWTHPQHPQNSGGVKTIYTANDLNQLDSISTQEGFSTPSDPVAITYDANGNMTYDGANQNYEWDAANRLTAINYIDTGDRTEFAYDGLGHRVKITEYGPAATLDVQPKSGGFVGFGSDEFSLPTGGYELKFEGLNPNGGNNSALIDSVSLNETLLQNGGFENPAGLTEDRATPEGSDWNYADTAGIAAATAMLMGGLSAPEGAQAAFVSNRGALWQYGTVTPSIYALSFQAAQFSGNDTFQTLRVTMRGATSTKTFVWNGKTIAAERDVSGTAETQRFFFAEGEQRIGGKYEGLYYYSRDHLGSIREVTNETGDLVAQYDYDAWGKPVVVNGISFDFGYTGHYFHQPSGLNLAMYRAYSPALGRWLSRDPIGEVAGLNLYAYVENDPTRRIDPSGLFGWDSVLQFIGKVVAQGVVLKGVGYGTLLNPTSIGGEVQPPGPWTLVGETTISNSCGSCRKVCFYLRRASSRSPDYFEETTSITVDCVQNCPPSPQ